MNLSHSLPSDSFLDRQDPAPRREPAAAPRPATRSRLKTGGQSPLRPEARNRRERRLMLVLVALAHAAAAIGFARFQPAPAEAPQPPITVALIEPPAVIPMAAPAPVLPTPPKPEVSKPQPAPPKAAPRQSRPAPAKVTPPPVPLTDSATAVSNDEPPTPPAPVVRTPAPPAEAPAAPPQPAVRSRPAETVAARFDAAYLNNPPPAYPPLSRRMREEGKVMLRVFVTGEGMPGKIELSASSGSRRLDTAAENAVSRWRFVPAKQDGRNVDAWVVVPIIFKLEGL
ncbi:energy transducer TonB [Aromatoleum bremense]|nr:energy transducer TonB [Aromatoleum bremense]